MRIAIIGSGPAGLTAASILAGQGINVTVYEASPDIGGLSKTILILGEPVEFGPHFLRHGFYDSMAEMIPELQGIKINAQDRKSSILFSGRILSYPPAGKDLLHVASKLKLLSYGWSYLRAKIKRPSTGPTAAAFLSSRLGGLFYRDFFEPYIQKIWGVPGSAIHEVFASSLLGAPVNLPGRIHQYVKKSIPRPPRYSEIIYPCGGFSVFWNALAMSIKKNGGAILTGVTINKIRATSTGFNIFLSTAPEDGKHYDYIISTIPGVLLQKLLHPIPGAPQQNGLAYRSLVLIYVKVLLAAPFPYHCLYIYEKTNPLARITNFSCFKKDAGPAAMLCLEYWVADDHALLGNDDGATIAQAIHDLNNISCLNNLQLISYEIKKLKRAFTIPNLRMPALLNTIEESFSIYPRLFLLGRNHSKNFNYSMEDAMWDGLKIAQGVAALKTP